MQIMISQEFSQHLFEYCDLGSKSLHPAGSSTLFFYLIGNDSHSARNAEEEGVYLPGNEWFLVCTASLRERRQTGKTQRVDSICSGGQRALELAGCEVCRLLRRGADTDRSFRAGLLKRHSNFDETL